MWKKIVILFLTLLGTAGAGYAYYSVNMDALGIEYRAGGKVTGRIHTLPSGINGGAHIGFNKGDKILMGTANPMGGDLAWLLIKERTYSDYAANGCNAEVELVCDNTPIRAWFSMAVSPIGRTNAGLATSDYVSHFLSSFGSANYADTNLYPIVQSLSGNILSNSQDQQILTYRDLTQLHAEYKNSAALVGTPQSCIAEEILGAMNKNGQLGKSIFVHALQETNGEMLMKRDLIPFSDTTFTEDYFSSTFYHTSTSPSLMYTNIRSNYQGGTKPVSGANIGLASSNVVLAIRPSAYLDLSQAVFGVSTGGSVGSIAQIEEPNIQSYSALHQAADQYDNMKVRIKDPNLSITFKDILNQKDESITQVAKDSKIKISANANAGSDSHGTYTVSVLVFKDDHFVYYRPLEAAKGDGTYEFDLKGMPAGEYKIGIVNESYNDDDNSLAACTAISAVKLLTIVEPLSQVALTPKTNLEVTKNVNINDPVASIISSVGITPITYTVVSDTSQNAHENDYQLFSISGSNVVVKEPNGLHAGDYYFKINAVDANGDPDGGITSATVHIVVGKTNLTIEFNEKSDTKKTATGAATNWNETATVTSNNSDVKITYSKVGGDIGLIDIDPDTGEIAYKGNGAYGKVKIRATVDDDPTSGNDNYNTAYTEKEIIICQELDGAITPHANSGDANVPTFSATDANVKSGGVIGTIKGTQGTPDNLSSGTITYTYGLKSDGDGSFFSVNATTGEIKTTANLPVGSYHITVTVIDKWSPSPKEIPVTINVGVAKAEELKFYENSSSNTVINQKTVNFTDTNVSVYATVKGSTNQNPVTYKIKDGSTNVITINPNSGVVTIKGTGTVIIVAEKKGVNGQADAQAELSFTVKPVSQAFIYTTDSTLSTERPKTGEKYNTLKETYAPNKTFHVYTTGNPTGSTVTYKLKDGSPTDVISVDADGTIHILNASMNNQIGKVIVEATSHDPSGNYEDKTIELPIDIEKGERTVEFKENPIHVVSGSGSVNPEILVDGTLDTSGTAVIEIDPNEDHSVAWTNDGAKIEYEWESEEAKDVKIKVTKPADRNYKAAEGEGILHILGAEENVLTLSTPGKVTYGDHFTIRSTQDDSMSTNVQYTFETDNGVYISAPQVTGNKVEFDALAYSGSTEINIKVTRTADGELPLTKTVKVKVLPKPISIEIEGKEKLRLEENPELTYKDFKDKLVTWNGVKDTINESVIKLSTTAGKYSPVGTYPISAKDAQKQLNDNYPNYTFTTKDGLLNVLDNGNKNFWDTDDDGCPDLNIEIEDENGDTILINGDKNEDGIPDYNIDTNGDGKPDLNIDTDNDGKPDLNLVQLKSWKPSKCVTVNGVQYASGITAKPEINIDLDNDGIPDINIDNKGDFKPHINISKDGKTPQVNIVEIHDWNPGKDYKSGNFLYDSIGPDDIQPELNIDTDGDGYPDLNLDLDGDGKADINVDLDGDGIPDVDIDSTGDGKPDVNVDEDGDGVPDTNIKDITEWKPEHNAKDPFPYDTMNFDEDDPDDSDSDDSDPSGKPNGEVQGSYYPGDNVGGALTGDTSNPLLYAGLSFTSLGIVCFLLHKHTHSNK